MARESGAKLCTRKSFTQKGGEGKAETRRGFILFPGVEVARETNWKTSAAGAGIREPCETLSWGKGEEHQKLLERKDN